VGSEMCIRDSKVTKCTYNLGASKTCPLGSARQMSESRITQMVMLYLRRNNMAIIF
jgi:hypothetical protein